MPIDAPADTAIDGEEQKPSRRRVPARLIEATPARNAWGQWLLASPAVLFLGWLWVDLFAYFSPIPWRPLDLLLGVAVYAALVVLPLGYAAHRLVTTFPRLFQNAGWDVQPLEPVRPAEQYTVRYEYAQRQRATTDRRRIFMRAAQGWVYLEIAGIFVGFLVMIPLFFSAVEFGFGR